jgi:hypothetical protein
MSEFALNTQNPLLHICVSYSLSTKHIPFYKSLVVANKNITFLYDLLLLLGCIIFIDFLCFNNIMEIPVN